MRSLKFSDLPGFIAFWSAVQLFRCLPFSVLYGLSRLLFWIFCYIIPMRRKIILENLTRSFPDKSPQEIIIIYKQHLRYSCDLIVEALKGFTMNEKDLCQRWRVLNPEIMQPYQKKNVIIVAAHYNNWEWGISLQPQIHRPCINVYKPLHNYLIDRYVFKSRKVIDVALLAIKETIPYLLSHREEINCYNLIADQHPAGSKEIHWMKFLHQDTAFITGPERLAKSFDYPVVYCAIHRVKRGYYTSTLTLITDQPQQTAEGEITEKSMRILEEQVLQQPPYWLWGHRRWKLSRPASS